MISSQEGKGTKIELYLPASLEAQRAEKEAPLEKPETLLSGLEVLLVEDNEQLRRTYFAQVRALGCTVHAAKDGPSAFALSEKLPNIDLLLTDVSLPHGISGPQIAEKMVIDYPTISVIFMSGFAAEFLDNRSGDQAKVQLLQKPFSQSELAQAMRDAVKDKRSQTRRS